MSWSNITGDQSILPGTSGAQDEVKLESGKTKKVRLLLPDGAEPYSYLEHCLEVETIENGQTVRAFRTIRCPKTTKNPNAHCPLCDGQQVRRRVRHVCNVYDYDEQKVQKLNAGEQVFKTIATTRKMGVDVLNVDWGLLKTGKDRNDTTYTVTNLGSSSFEYNPETMGTLFDVEAEYAPGTIEEMQATVESVGGNWAALTTPPVLVYPTLKEALDHEMPNGKYKGQKFSQIWESDKSPRGFIAYLALKSDRQNAEKAAAQVIYTRLGGVMIDGVPMEDGQPTVQNTSANATPTPTPTANSSKPAQTATPTADTAKANSSERTNKINEINKIFTSNPKYLSDFNVVIAELQKYGNGKTNIQDFTDEELDALYNGCDK